MFWKRRSRTFRVLISLIVLFGLCFAFLPQTLDQAYVARDEHQNKCTPPNDRVDPRFWERPDGQIKVIQLTNAGEFVNRCQLTDVLDDLLCNHPNIEIDVTRAKYNPIKGCKKNREQLPKLTVMYVHGWQHGADENDTDRVAFAKMIAEIKIANPKKSVLGVYVSWNASGPLPKDFDLLTFWAKKNIADRVAQAGAMTLVVSSIGALSNASSFVGNQFITIGHSFGARLLFSATSQSIIYETQRAHPLPPSDEYKLIRAATDAVVLLNPAFEASMYSAVNGITRGSVTKDHPTGTEEKFRGDQPPLIVTISTSADSATGTWFPIGQWFDGRRSDLENVTLGNEEAYRTHTLKKKAESDCIYKGKPFTEASYINGICMERLARTEKMPSQLNNPFLVVGTDKNVLAEHSKIWLPDFLGWMTTFIKALGDANDSVSKNASP